MTFGLSGAALAGIAVGGATLVSGYMGSQAAGDAAAIQGQASEAGIAEQRRQFEEVQKLLEPYVTAGTGAITGHPHQPFGQHPRHPPAPWRRQKPGRNPWRNFREAQARNRRRDHWQAANRADPGG